MIRPKSASVAGASQLKLLAPNANKASRRSSGTIIAATMRTMTTASRRDKCPSFLRTANSTPATDEIAHKVPTRWVDDAAIVPLPMLEPRGAIRADLTIAGKRLRVVGMHLDISGIRRRQQVRTILAHVGGCAPPCPTVLMGDLNEWSPTGGALRVFGDHHILAPGRSFHSRQPMAMLDRIIHSPDMVAEACGVHHSALASRASDHLPVWAVLHM